MSYIIQYTVLVLSLCSISQCYGVVPQPCPPNEVFTKCKNECPTPVCSNPTPPTCLTVICKPGCECKEGYIRIRKPDGLCIPIAKCLDCLKPDFMFKECGSLCNNTCEQVLSGQHVCPDICVPGCYCRRGVFDKYRNRCIPPKYCRRKHC